jgi:hypothetical protein
MGKCGTVGFRVPEHFANRIAAHEPTVSALRHGKLSLIVQRVKRKNETKVPG